MRRFSMTGALDQWLENRGIVHPIIMPVIRNQIVLLLVAFFIGSAGAPENLWGIWFSCGFAVMTFILYSWARFFLRRPWGEFNTGILMNVLLHFILRLVILAAGLFASVIWGKASPIALLAGVATGTFAPLLTLAWERFNTTK